MFLFLKKTNILFFSLIFPLHLYSANSTSSHSSNPVMSGKDFLEILRLQNIIKDHSQARKNAASLLHNLNIDSELQKPLKEIFQKLTPFSFNLKKALKFMSGRSEQIFCKNAGLVHMKGFHDDGENSEVFLINNSRQMVSNSFNLVSGGKWEYRLLTSYRSDPIDSKLWVEEKSQNSLIIRETRNNDIDLASYLVQDNILSDKSKKKLRTYEVLNKTYGYIYEPAPMFMAFEYAHLWGTKKLSLIPDTDFRKGYEDTITGETIEISKDIFIQARTKRIIDNFYPYYSYTSKKKKYEYTNCWKVNSQIIMKKTKDNN